MRIAVACDHAGFPLKDVAIRVVIEGGHQVIDLGTNDTEPVDYPDYAFKLAQTIITGNAERGILICGSGVGASIAANKMSGIYAGLCHDDYSAAQGVEHDNMNVLCLGARVIGPALVPGLVTAFLNAQFSNAERHRRRFEKVRTIEHNQNVNEE